MSTQDQNLATLQFFKTGLNLSSDVLIGHKSEFPKDLAFECEGEYFIYHNNKLIDFIPDSNFEISNKWFAKIVRYSNGKFFSKGNDSGIDFANAARFAFQELLSDMVDDVYIKLVKVKWEERNHVQKVSGNNEDI